MQLKAISSMATRHLLSDLIEAFRAKEDISIKLTSIGGIDAAARVRDGEDLDLVVLDSKALAELAVAGHVREDTIVPIVVSNVAVVIAESSDSSAPFTLEGLGPAFGTSEELRLALLNATGIAYSTGPSGKAVVEMIESLAIRQEVESRLVQSKPGTPVTQLLNEGVASIGFQQLSEIAGTPGTKVVGLLSGEHEITTTFSGAVAATSNRIEQAQKALRHWASPDAASIKKLHHFSIQGESHGS